jgi:hypothetical protein
MDVDNSVIHLLQEMTRIPAALKSWRTPVLDLLNDNRIFNCTPEDANKWRPIVKALYDSDKTALPEILGEEFHVFEFDLTTDTFQPRWLLLHRRISLPPGNTRCCYAP